MVNLGDRAVGSTLSFDFSTHKADGTPITLSGSPVISVYKDSTTESTSGVTLTADYDTRTGMHHVVIDTSANGTFYATGNDFSVVITTGTVDSISVVGYPVARFSIGRANISHITSTAQTARDIGASVLLSSGTGAGQLDFTSGVVKANVTQIDGSANATHATGMIAADARDILGTAISSPATAGILDVNIKNMNNVAATSITTINANQGTTQPVNYTGTGATAYVKSDAVNIGGAVPASATIGTVTTVTNQLTAAAIATGVWQDATAGDFTTASSIGKALYIANVAPGSSGGHMISGSNAGTTTLAALTITGATTLTGAVTATNASNDINGCNIQKINSQSVTASTGITANANLGTTQPVNFTGTSTTAYVKTDMVDIAGASVSTSTAQLGVNAVQHGGTAQTGRDIGASVLLSNGTGTGQISLSSGAVTVGTNNDKTGYALASTAVNVTAIDGVALPTHASGKIPADVLAISNSAVNAGSAQIGVNVVQFGTTVVTGRDIGTSVLISSGGGVGQLDVTGGVVKANVTQSDGVSLGTHASGILPADVRDIMGSAVSTSTAQLGVNVVSGGSSDPAAIADAVWDEAISGHLTAGSTGAKLNSAASAGDPWTTALPGAYGAGTAGYILGTNLDAKSSDIKTQTNKMQFDGSSNIKSVKNATTAGTADFNTTEKASITTACTASTPTVTVSGTMDSNVIKVDGVTLGTHASGMLPADARDILGTAISTPATAGILDVNIKNMNNVAATSIATINANQGTSQPINFTGTSTSALVKSDTVDIAGASVSTSTAQIGVNVVSLSSGLDFTSTQKTSIENTVWDAAISGHLTAGSTGAKLNSAAAAGDPWSTSLPGAYGAGTAGYILGTNLNAKVGDVKTQTDKMAFDSNSYIKSDLEAIETVTLASTNAILNLKKFTVYNSTGDAVTFAANSTGNALTLTASGSGSEVSSNYFNSIYTHTQYLTFNGSYVNANLKMIEDTTTNSVLLAYSISSTKVGTVDSANITPTSTIFDTSISEALTNHWARRWLIFRTGSLSGCASPVQGYQLVAGKGRILCTALPQAPAHGDLFIIV